MTRHGLDRAERLFAEALEVPREAREAFVAQACPDDPALRQQVLRLLAADETAATSGLPSPTLWLPADTHTSGQMVGGRYRLLRLIGTGGLGVVWHAEQTTPVQRQVALKFIRHDFDGRHVALRFAMERAALSLMDHPGIAKIHDAGVESDGRPYFAMELVQGEPITIGCDRARTPIEGRVALLAEVCHAVHHAHQKGIVHRDLKPSNILVTDVDGRQVAKVIDFGIAKAFARDSSAMEAPTAVTRVGQFVGTPAYMAPEQLAGDGAAVDVRSDIYALGVVLHELLAGCLPHDRSSAALASPPGLTTRTPAAPSRPPSASVRRLPSSQMAAIATTRGETSRSLRRRLRGELDWIVGRAMAEEPHRRYASASEMAEDLQRWLRLEPIAAGPPGAVYRLRKFAQRHTALVASGILLAASLALGLAGTSIGLVRARIAEEEQRSLRLTAEEAARSEKAQRSAALAAAQRATLVGYKAQLGAAAMAIAGDDVATARRLLEATDPALRGWEWSAVSHLTDQADLVIDLGGAIPTSLTLTPDASEVLVACRDGVLRGFDTSTGEELRRVTLPVQLVHGLDIAPTGDRLVVCGRRRDNFAAIEYWLLEWPSARELAGGPGRTSSRAFAPDGSLVAYADLHTANVHLLAPDTGELVRSVDLPGDSIGVHVAFGLDPRTLGFGDGQLGFVGIVDLAEGSVRRWPVPSLWYGSFDPRSGLFLGGDERGDAILMRPDAPERPVLLRNRSPRGELRYVHPSRDGRLAIASSSTGGAVQIHDLERNRPLGLLSGHRDHVLAADVSLDGRTLATASQDGTIRLWRLPPAESRFVVPLTDPTGRVGGAVSADGSLVASGGWGNLQLWRSSDGTLLWSRDLGAAYVELLTFSPDLRRLAVAETNGRAMVVAVEDGSLRRILPSIGEGHTAMAWDPLDRWIVLAGADGTLRRITTQTPSEAPRLPLFDGPVTALALSKDGSLFAAGAGAPILARDNWGEIIKTPPAAPELVLGRLEDGQVLARVPLIQGPSALCFSTDGQTLFLGRNDGSVLGLVLGLVLGDAEDPRLEAGRVSTAGGLEGLSESSAFLCVPASDPSAAAPAASPPAMSWHQVSSLSMSPDGSRLLVGRRIGSVDIALPVADGQLLTLDADWSIHAAVIAEDDGALVVASRTPLMRFQRSLPSRQRADARERVRLVRSIVDPIVISDRLHTRVLARLNKLDLDDALRNEAVSYAQARGEYVAIMVSQAIERARDPAAGRERHELALEWISHIDAQRDGHHSAGASAFDLLRAVLCLRLGDAATSRALLERSVATDGPADASADLAAPAVLALALLRLGQVDEASRIVQAIRSRLDGGEELRGEALWYVPEAIRALEDAGRAAP